MNTRIALVEDDNGLRASMVRLLKRTSWIRVVADYADAKSALADIARRKPDVVLMDVNMPEMGGVECVSAPEGTPASGLHSDANSSR